MTVLLNLLIVVSSLLDQGLALLFFWLLIRPSPRLLDKKFYILAVLIFSAVCIGLSFVPIHYLIKTGVIFVLNVFYCLKISDHKLGISLFLPILEISSIFACESVVPFLLSILFPQLVFSEISDTAFLIVFGILSSRSLLYLLWGASIMVVYRRAQSISPSHIHTPQWITLCSAVGLLTSFVVAFQWMANSHPENIASILAAFPVIFLVVVSLFLLLAMNLSREVQRKYLLQGELLLAEQQLEQQKAIASMYDQIRGMQHDFRNHMQIISALAEQQHDEEVSGYVKGIAGQFLTGKSLISTGILAIDSLMNSKFIHAQKLGIEITAEVCFPEPLLIPVPDLCTALFNLLDNAIEACEKNYNPASRWIRLNLYQHENFLVVSCGNPSEVKPVSHKYGFRTTKAGDLHGIGMRQLQRIAEKHHGFFHAEYLDGIFSAKLALSHRTQIKQIHTSYVSTERKVEV